jgi:hypothetical protein
MGLQARGWAGYDQAREIHKAIFERSARFPGLAKQHRQSPANPTASSKK